MAALDFLRPHPDASLDETLDAISDRAKTVLKGSFAAMVGVDPSKRDAIIDSAIAAGFSIPFDTEELAEKLKLPLEKTAIVLNGASFLVALTGSFVEADDSDLLNKLAAHKLVLERDFGVVREWLYAVREKSGGFRDAFERDSLANKVLPSLQGFDVVVDVRLSFSKDEGMPGAVPVAIAMLDTDADGQTIWFQMSKTQLQRLQAKLHTVAKQFEVAEKLAAKA